MSTQRARRVFFLASSFFACAVINACSGDDGAGVVNDPSPTSPPSTKPEVGKDDTGNETSLDAAVDAPLAPDATTDATPPVTLDGGVPDATPDAGSDAAPEAGTDPCDLDGDGYKGPQCAGGTDCDDSDPLTNPGQKEADDWTSAIVDTDYHPCPTCNFASQLTAWRFWDVALALAPDGTARIAVVWNDPQNASLRLYTENAQGTFTKTDVEPLDSSGKGNTAIAVDAAGYVHLAYIKSVSAQPNNIGNLRYATNAGGAWTMVDIDAVWDWYAPFGFAIEPSNGKAHFVYVPKRAGETPRLEHAVRSADGTIAREPVGTTTIPSEVSMVFDGSRVRGLYRNSSALSSFDSLAAGGFSVTPIAGAAAGGLVTTLGPQATLHASHFDGQKSLRWTREAAAGFTTDTIASLDSPEQQRAGIYVSASRADFFALVKPPGWNIHFLTQLTKQGGNVSVNRIDQIGNCATLRCRLPLAARSDGALRGAAIHHFFAGALKQWQDKLVFYRRPKTDGIDRSCNGE